MRKKIIILLLTYILSFAAVPNFAATSQDVQPASGTVTLNGITIENETMPYPLIVYNDITYMPMTWDFSRLLGLTLAYDAASGLSLTPGAANSQQVLTTVAAPVTDFKVSVVNYPITINGVPIDNTTATYPLLNINGITYFPLTWSYAVDMFGWDYVYSETTGLSIAPKEDASTELDYIPVETTFDSIQNIYPLLKGSRLPSQYSTFGDSDTLKSYFQRNQGTANTCWAFAANSLFELAVYKSTGEILDFSEDHLIHHAPIPVTYDSGGYFKLAAAYYSNGTGPILESEDPYNDNRTNDTADPKYLLTGYAEIKDDLEAVKTAIYKYGGAVASISLNESGLKYFSDANNSYYNNDPDAIATHEFVLVGWDDSYAPYHFKKSPSASGAFIAMNSWGDDWGDGGLFYISYEDVNILKDVYAITDFEAADRTTTLYNYNPTGITRYEGYVDYNYATGMNAFVANDDENLTAVSFYVPEHDTQYEIRLDLDDDGVFNLTTAVSGFIGTKGYYTVYLPKAMPLEAGQTFCIAITMTSDFTDFILPIEAPYPAIDYTLTGHPGESYITLDPDRFTFKDLSELYDNANIGIRAFTQPIVE
jgi:C1A family cysteine protease